jgi:hypothetical protein
MSEQHQRNNSPQQISPEVPEEMLRVPIPVIAPALVWIRVCLGLGFLACAVSAFVRRADEAALDEHVPAFLNRHCDVFGEPGEENADAMPLSFRGPFVVGVLPGPLRRDGKHGELRSVAVPRLTLLRVCADEADDP